MNNIQNITTNTLIDELRQIRDQINLEIQDLSLEELKEYWKTKETLHPTWAWQRQSEQK